MKVAHRYLFNFSASPVGGGLKRLYEYAKWFDANGGAWFMVHARCEGLRDEFPRNGFFVVKRSAIARMLDDFGSVRGTVQRLGAVPDCYYSYGIPLYQRVGRINWFHLSNVLPLAWRSVPKTPLGLRIKFSLLGRRIVRGLPNADVISAESKASLELIDPRYRDRVFLSVNGSDDELDHIHQPTAKEHVATVVGTYPHKALDESYQVFERLRSQDDQLELMVFGDDRLVSRHLRDRPKVVLMGSRPRGEVIEQLRRSKYYISTTCIENSYNAASEGISLADESYISDIGPHRELLDGVPHDRVEMTESHRPMLHVRRRDISGRNLKTWDAVVREMNRRIQTVVSATSAAGEHVDQ